MRARFTGQLEAILPFHPCHEVGHPGLAHETFQWLPTVGALMREDTAKTTLVEITHRIVSSRESVRFDSNSPISEKEVEPRRRVSSGLGRTELRSRLYPRLRTEWTGSCETRSGGNRSNVDRLTTSDPQQTDVIPRTSDRHAVSPWPDIRRYCEMRAWNGNKRKLR